MDRRDFLHSACQACAAVAFFPVIASLEGCASVSGVVTNGTIAVPLAKIKEDTTVVKAKGLDDDLLLVKRPDGSYTALVLNCPHKGGPLKEKNGELLCSWHGSRFDLEGKVLEGPSRKALTHYPVEAVGDALVVRMT